MTWEKGVSGNTAGRPAGTANVNKYRVLKIFEDFNPLENLKIRALQAEREKDWDRYERLNIELAPYFAPKFKSVELKDADGNPLNFVINIAREGVQSAAGDNIHGDTHSS